MAVRPGRSQKGKVSTMFEWWNSLELIQQVFYVIAIPATVILLLQTILLLFGVGHGGAADTDQDLDMDMDADHDGDIQVDHDFDDGAEHVAGLRLLTVRGIVAFLAVGGWVGVALLDMDVNTVIASVVAVAAGLLAMLLVALALKFAMRMQQSGNLDMKNAVGLTGEVYLPIPEGGKGKVTLVVQERFMEMDAICPSQSLKTGQRVRVTEVTESNTLVVVPIS